jgi:CHAT domain-containing protein
VRVRERLAVAEKRDSMSMKWRNTNVSLQPYVDVYKDQQRDRERERQRETERERDRERERERQRQRQRQTDRQSFNGQQSQPTRHAAHVFTVVDGLANVPLHQLLDRVCKGADRLAAWLCTQPIAAHLQAGLDVRHRANKDPPGGSPL